jgi:hypothetical protein
LINPRSQGCYARTADSEGGNRPPSGLSPEHQSSPVIALVNSDLFFGLQYIRKIRIFDLEARLLGHPFAA